MRSLFFLLSMTIILLASSCEGDGGIVGDDDMPSLPPNANFTKSPLIVIADKTNVQFENTSSGDIDDYRWQFEDGLGTSSQRDPNYVFDYEGAREVSLTVTGSGGSDKSTKTLVVHAFDPNCSNFNSSSTHSIQKINALRENGLVRNGTIFIKNNYNVTVDLLLYSPVNWLNGVYTRKHSYSLPSGAEGTLNVGGQNGQFSNEWGIRVQGTNGTISCIRTVGTVAEFNGSRYSIQASTILEGN